MSDTRRDEVFNEKRVGARSADVKYPA